MNRTPGYSPEVWERSVQLVLTNEHGHSSRLAAKQYVAAKIGCTSETLRTWINKIEVDSGSRSGVTSDQAQRMKELEREVRELKRANEIPKKAAVSSPWRSSTVDRSNGRFYRPLSLCLRCRANLGRVADCAVDVLSMQRPRT